MDIEALRMLSLEDAKSGANHVKIIEPHTASKEAIIESVKANVLLQMDTDRKSTALKQLQGHMWRSGYENGILKG